MNTYILVSGLMTDAYGEKSAVISWLVPTRNTDSLNFDPSVYILGKLHKILKYFANQTDIAGRYSIWNYKIL